jgi:hypothetical protein
VLDFFTDKYFNQYRKLNPWRRINMKTLNILILVLLGFVSLTLIISFPLTSSAQLFSFNPFLVPYNPFLNPAYSFPFVPPVTAFAPSVLNPVLSPYTALPSLYSRGAAATLIVVPPPAPTVTAYAPLGTLNLTPSTLVFLILYLTLPE